MCFSTDWWQSPGVAAEFLRLGRSTRRMPMTGPHEVAFAIRGPIERENLPGLCDRVCALLREHGPGDVVCDVRGVAPDAVTVDALARLQLAARRLRCRVLLHGASSDLLGLVELTGLTDVLPDR
jgi:ABC-type transporter Mla MlaB component